MAEQCLEIEPLGKLLRLNEAIRLGLYSDRIGVLMRRGRDQRALSQYCTKGKTRCEHSEKAGKEVSSDTNPDAP
jgi:hypothetical protein